MKSIWTPADLDLLQSQYSTVSNTQLSRQLSKTKKQICAKAHELGLSKLHTSKYENTVEKLLEDTEEAWYWVGFLLADGSFSHRKSGAITLALKLASKDSEHLAKFGNFIGYSGTIGQAVNLHGYAGSSYVRLSITSKLLTQLLSKFSIPLNKTENPPTLEVPNDIRLFQSLILGYIDGDGGIDKVKQQIKFTVHCSWKPVLEQFRHFLITHYNLSLAEVRINKRGYAYWSINKTSALFLKAQIGTLPVMQRKWGLL